MFLYVMHSAFHNQSPPLTLTACILSEAYNPASDIIRLIFPLRNINGICGYSC